MEKTIVAATLIAGLPFTAQAQDQEVKVKMADPPDGGKLVKLESITKGGALAAYGVTVKKGGKTSEVKVAPDGRVMK